VAALRITFARSPLARALGFLVMGSALVGFWKWDSLNSHARGLILAAYGVTLGGFMLIPALRTRRLLQSGAMAQGTVVDAKRYISISEDSITSYAPVVRFTTADGRTVEFTSSEGYSSKPDVGGAVDVRYLPDDPEQAEIDRATTWMLPAAFGLLGGLGLLVAGVVVYSDEPQAAPAMVDSVDGTGQVEPAREPLPSSRPAVATGRIGDRLAVYDEVGNVQLVVTVTRLKFSTGDEFDQPLHGFFMGANVEAHALADDQYIFNFHALVGGQLYVAGAITGSTAFDPSPEPGPLHAGERRAGWLVFDVPARHGQLVLRDLDDHNVGVWKY
jgi:Protein of unknown function (DUF3592)